MNLLTSSQIRAAEIAAIHAETLGFLRSQALRSFGLLAGAPEPQEVLDAFGPNAVAALQTYQVLRGALAQLGAAEGLPEVDLTRFVPQADGRVTHVPPVHAPEEPEDFPPTD
jgi:hypothetical protein